MLIAEYLYHYHVRIISNKKPFPFELIFPSGFCLLLSAFSSPKCKYLTGHDITN